MTKVTFKVIRDAISAQGRHISITVTSTSDTVVNDYLSLPITINKTYDVNESLQNIKKDMKMEIKSYIDSAKKTISVNNLVGKEITITI